MNTLLIEALQRVDDCVTAVNIGRDRWSILAYLSEIDCLITDHIREEHRKKATEDSLLGN